MTGQVTVNIKEIYTQAEWLHNFNRGDIASTVWSTVKKEEEERKKPSQS